MKEELAEEDVGETKDDLPPAFRGVSRTESLIERLPHPQFEVDDEEKFEDAEGGEQDAPIVAQGAEFRDAPDDEPLPQLEVPLLEVEQHELELPSTSTFQPIDDEPLPPPFVPSLQAQPDYEEETDNEPLPYIKEEEEDFNFGITPEELATSSALLTELKKAEANEPAVFKPLKEIDEDEFYRQAQSALGGDMIFIKPEPLLFGGDLQSLEEQEKKAVGGGGGGGKEKPKVTKSKVTIKDELQRGAREKAAAEAAAAAMGQQKNHQEKRKDDHLEVKIAQQSQRKETQQRDNHLCFLYFQLKQTLTL